MLIKPNIKIIEMLSFGGREELLITILYLNEI
ncbi:hypothetical protein PPEP_a6007 [Pseudoalteromonas peptidolytica F12-50-A1]|uniref:Uncharacterized protein n=1 Tax=Pseudoalteromonas peptidolytica F12-50-A1 TaxID=1315280 RepID=A0A8I0MX81_9GAMM|nr:hypothetical protein [Pseudoalteromonas peptidolytica F12-50-A1]